MKLRLILLGLVAFTLAACANGKYVGPSIGASVGFNGMSVGVTLYGENPVTKPQVTGTLFAK